MSITTVHLLRHGEVENPDGLLYGRMRGFGLSQRGAAMAEGVADYLAGTVGGRDHHQMRRDITHIVSSPLLRARQTARPIAQRLDLPVTTDVRLVEAGNHFEGQPTTARVLASPRYWYRYRNPLRPSWGEPYTRIVLRMAAAVETARLAAQGHEALVVSHQLPIWTIRQAMEGHRLAHIPTQRQCTLASITSLVFDGVTLVSVGYIEPVRDLLP